MSAPDAIAAMRRTAWVRSLARLGSARDYVFTFGAEFAVLASTLVTLKLAAEYWNTASFGEYVLARRTLSLLQLPIACGMPVALTRFIARARAEGRPGFERQCFVAGLVIALASIALALAVLLGFASLSAKVLLGDSARIPLLGAVCLGAAGLVLHGVVYGALRGQLQMSTANLLQVVNLGLVPVLVLATHGRSPEQVVGLMGGVWCVVAGLAVSAVRSHMSARRDPEPGGRGAALTLLRYGAPRVPGEFALGALSTVPVTVVTHTSGIVAAGFVGLGVSLTSMVGSLFAPLGQIVLPAVSAHAVGPERTRLQGDAFRVTALCVALAAAGVVGLELTVGWAIPLFLGSEYAAAVPVIRLMLLGAVPYVAYIVLRAVLDALHTRPLNAKNLAVGLAVLIALCSWTGTVYGIAWSYVAALVVVGALSVVDARRALARLAAS
ncbi:MAG TPA: lipopolysaccharide biosynthesis protein [Gemmatimonadales bacterium]|nr:lipopolysaccharide biosynthesis protein [Gemmatimonadales bacterium]